MNTANITLTHTCTQTDVFTILLRTILTIPGEGTKITNPALALVAVHIVIACALASIHTEVSSAVAPMSLVRYRVFGSEQILRQCNVASLENKLAISVQNTKLDANHAFDKAALIARIRKFVCKRPENQKQ